MAITRVNASTATAAASSMSVNVPSGVSDGDYLVLGISAATESSSITTPSGWTALRNQTDVGNGQKLWSYHRIASSEPASYTVSVSPAEDMAAIMIAYRGTDSSLATVVQAQAGANGGNTAAQSSPSVTSTTDGAMILAFFGADSNTDHTPVTADSSPAATAEATVFQSGNNISFFAEDYILPTAGAQVLDCTFNSAPSAGVVKLAFAIGAAAGAAATAPPFARERSTPRRRALQRR